MNGATLRDFMVQTISTEAQNADGVAGLDANGATGK